MRLAKRRDYLTERDRRVLQFIARYRAATEEMLHRVIFRSLSGKSAARVIRRLVRRGLLHQVTIGPALRYVVLTRRGCRAIGVLERLTRPLTEQSLPTTLAIGWYCLRTGLVRLTDAEFHQRYPELWKPGLRSSVYFLADTADGLKLGMFIVDRGATPRRLKGKIHRLIAQRFSLPAFTALIEAKRFRVTVLTGLPAQQQNLRRHLKRPYFRRVEVEIALIPELGELLTWK